MKRNATAPAAAKAPAKRRPPAPPPIPAPASAAADDSSETSSSSSSAGGPATAEGSPPTTANVPPTISAIIAALRSEEAAELDVFGNPVAPPPPPQMPSERAIVEEYHATAASTGEGKTQKKRSRSQKAGQFQKTLEKLFPPGKTSSKALEAAMAKGVAEEAPAAGAPPAPMLPPIKPPPVAVVRASTSEARVEVRPMSHYYSTFEPSVVKTPRQLADELYQKLMSQLEALYSDHRLHDEIPYAPPESFAEYVGRLETPPYRQRMAALTQGRELRALDVPVVTRVYISKYLRPANPNLRERPCSRGYGCMSLKLNNHPHNTVEHARRFMSNVDRLFPMRQALAAQTTLASTSIATQQPPPATPPTAVGEMGFSPERLIVCREFLLPDEENAFFQSGELPAHPGKCIVCTIFEVTCAYYQYRQKGPSERAPECLQSFQVDVDVPGGYSKEACLGLGKAQRESGIFYPYPAFELHHYSWRCDQSGVYKVEEQNMDFQSASAGTAASQI